MKKFIQKLLHPLVRKYRVDLIDDERLSSSRHFSIRPIVWVGLGLGVILFLVGGTASLIWYTPAIRTNIPGYAKPENDQKILAMQTQIENLESSLKQKDEYIASMQNALQSGGIKPSDVQEGDLGMKQIENNPGGLDKGNGGAADKNTKKDDKQNTKVEVATTPVVAQPNTGDAALIKHSEKKILGIQTIMRPVIGFVREGYSPVKGHYGIDIVTKANETVLAATEGYVQMAEYVSGEGYTIVISSTNGGVNTVYKHCSRLLKKKGERVQAIEPIAIVGNTGENSTGPHLHFEMWINGEPLNPVEYIPGYMKAKN